MVLPGIKSSCLITESKIELMDLVVVKQYWIVILKSPEWINSPLGLDENNQRLIFKKILASLFNGHL